MWNSREFSAAASAPKETNNRVACFDAPAEHMQRFPPARDRNNPQASLGTKNYRNSEKHIILWRER